MCLVNCSFCWYRYFSKSNLVTFLKCRNFLKLIFSALIYTIEVLVALLKFLFSFSIFLVSLEQIVCNFLSVFSYDQVSRYNSNISYSSTCLIIALNFSNRYLSAVYLKSHSLYFLFYFFLSFSILLLF